MCGILGIVANNHVVSELYDGMLTLQHRGQDAAGVTTYDGHRFHVKKGNGLAREVFKERNVARLVGNIGIGHVRYPTAGFFTEEEAQPFFVNSPFGISLVHNGNLTNASELTKQVEEENMRSIMTNSDSELLLNVIADEILKLRKKKLEAEDVFKAMEAVFKRVKGGFAAIAYIAGQGMIAFRDPSGIRPLVFGKREANLETEYMFSSESVPFDTLGYELIRDLHPGEVIFVDSRRRAHAKKCVEKIHFRPCIFEYVYLARPDSIIDEVSVYKSRLRMGESLAKQVKKAEIEIDVVIPIPDSSRSAALTLAHNLGVKYREGIVKNRYIGRTFIMPGQHMRQKSIKQKLNTLPLEIKDKSVLLVDDSIVRGNTIKLLIEMVKRSGAKKIYVASAAPPLISPCVYGVDMPSKKEFIANGQTIDQIAKEIGADGLFYQDLADLKEACREGNPEIEDLCAACMDKKYPTDDVTEEILNQMENIRCGEKAEGKVEEMGQLKLT
ncbi:amidophosphoribosyltransferase [Candidatus Peregrinibacteria bacterium]|jgi:amidophosphoribosyltransferase|nr:amidophosphoribosyltransferase [Candidatus Peregrinibacteria bacterium]